MGYISEKLKRRLRQAKTSRKREDAAPLDPQLLFDLGFF